MKITSYVSFLYCLCLMLASPTVQASEVRTAIFEGKPCINPPHVVGNYPATPFLFYIPTSGERPIKWHAENLPKGLKLDKETGIIKGKVVEKGTYKVMLKAENALGTDTQELLINIGDELLLTPPMGWNSWNTFGRHLTEELLLQTADAMVENGMRDLGYAYINIDDFWQLPERGADGQIDARDFASWGVDLLKYDYCNAPAGRVEAMERYEKMGRALRATDRSIVFSICEWGQREPWKWAKKVGGHLWRVSGDIGDLWNRSTDEKGGLRGILNILEINAPLSEYARPGGWNDPDMLVVGIGGKSKSIGYESEGCTNEQYQSHFALWCMMASPLLCGNDVRQMNDSTLQILLNKDLIAIDQDPLGIQAERAIRADHYDVWVKPLSDGSKAIACLNRISGPVDVELNVKTVEGLSLDRVYDVIEGSLVAEASTGWVVKLAPGECKVFICK